MPSTTCYKMPLSLTTGNDLIVYLGDCSAVLGTIRKPCDVVSPCVIHNDDT